MKPISYWLGLAAVASLSMTAPANADQRGEANVRIVKSFLVDIRAAMASKDPARIRAVAERYMAPDYVQHSKLFAPGREGYIGAMTGMLAKAPEGRSIPGPGRSAPNDLRFFGDGDYVAWVTQLPPGAPGPRFDFNMERIVNGKLSEHWDAR